MVFRYRDYRFLMGSTFFNSFAYWTEQVALGWLMLTLTDSPLMVGLAYASRMIPFFFLGIPAGVVADQVNRRLFLRALTACIAATWFVVVALIVTDSIQAWHLILLAGMTGCLRAFFSTTYTSLVYDIVGPRDAVTGMAWSSVVSHGSGIVGAVLAGTITARAGSAGAYLASGASFLVSLVLLFFMRESGQAAPRRTASVRENVQGAMRVLRANRVLLGLTLLTASSEMFGFSAAVILPTLARDVLHVGASGLGLMVAVRSGAGIVGPLLVSALAGVKRQGYLLVFTAAVFGGAIAALGLVPSLAMALAVLAVANAAGSALDVLIKTLMQAHVSNEERGRAMGAWVVGIGTGPVGQVEIGAVVAALSVALGLMVNGGALLLVTLAIFICIRPLQRI